jgi:hypothetical protein
VARWIRGHDELKVYGMPPPWDGEFRRLASRRYGVEINAVAGCVVTQELCSYVDGYNAVTHARLLAHFGKDIFAECEEDARTAWQKAQSRE